MKAIVAGMARRPCALAGALVSALLLLVFASSAGAWIYWGHEQPYGAGVGRGALDGTQVNEAFVPGPPGAYAFSRGVAVDSGHIYWGTHGLGSVSGGELGPARIGRSQLDGSSPEYAFAGSASGGITGLAASPAAVYYTSANIDTSQIVQISLTGGGESSFSSVFGQPNPKTCGVASDGTYVYFANPYTSSIGRAKIADFGTANPAEGQWIQLPAVTSETVVPCGVAVDGRYVYWGIKEVFRNGVIGLGTSIGRALKAEGGEATDSFAAIGKEVTGLATDGAFIYASNFDNYAPGGGSIGRVAVNGNGADPNFISGLSSPFGVAVDAGGPGAAPAPSGGGVGVPPPRFPVGCNSCGGGTLTGPDIPPDFSRVWGSNATFAPASWVTPGYAVAKSASARGTVFNYILDKPGTIRIAIVGSVPGRRVGKRCVAQAPKNTGARSCSRAITLMTLTRVSAAGHSQVRFSGRVRGRVLAAGSYTARFIATAVVGKATRIKSLHFRIVSH